MSTSTTTYNVIIKRFEDFATAHPLINRFTYGTIQEGDIGKSCTYPWMHVAPSSTNYDDGQRGMSFDILFADLVRDKDDKPENEKEIISDCSQLFEDLLATIENNTLFGDNALLQKPITITPFLNSFTNNLTGVEGTVTIELDYTFDFCSVPVDFNLNIPTSGGGAGGGVLTFDDSLNLSGTSVTLDNDVDTPGNDYYYGTDATGTKGWYVLPGGGGPSSGTVTSVAVTVPSAFTVSGSPITTSGTIAIAGNGTTSQYVDGTGALQTTATTLPPSGAAGGDLTGTYPNPTVHKVHGVDFQSGTPSDNEVWIYKASAAKWQHQHVHASEVTNDSQVTGTNVDDALDHLDTTKEPTITAGTTSQYWRGDKSWQTLDKTAVGLGNIDNTSDASKPISTATQTALNGKLSNQLFTFNVGTAIAGSTTTWIATGVTAGSNESISTVIIPHAITLSNMYLMHYSTNQPASGSQVITVRKNAVDTALVITIAAGAVTSTTPYSNLANTVSFAVGDKLSIRRVNNATATGGIFNGLSFSITN